ncbi:MAG: hypothetical protein WDM96_19255 [Lacunisphaera sp.]
MWPRARFVTARSVADAAGQPATGRQLLILGNPDEAEIGLAAQMLDAGDLPRWALVCLGGEASDLAESVPPEDWNVALLARVFRSTLLQHELLRENLQLRGDLKTIARRVSHDARTPLGCIQTLCELIQHAPPADAAALGESSRRHPQLHGEINLLIDRVSSLVRASLDPLPPSVFAMGTVVEAALRQLQTEVAGSAKKIRQPAHWPEAEGIMEWTELIWWNLIRNALAHGHRAGAIQLGWTRDNGSVRFWVSSPGAVPAESFPAPVAPAFTSFTSSPRPASACRWSSASLRCRAASAAMRRATTIAPCFSSRCAAPRRRRKRALRRVPQRWPGAIRPKLVSEAGALLAGDAKLSLSTSAFRTRPACKASTHRGGPPEKERTPGSGRNLAFIIGPPQPAGRVLQTRRPYVTARKD